MRESKERLKDILEAIATIEPHLHRANASLECNELLRDLFVQNVQIAEESQVIANKARTQKSIGNVTIMK